MKLSAFGVLTNENVHPAVAAFLRGSGLDVVTASEAQLLGAEDAAVLRRATTENRLVLTHDADFGRLTIAGGEPFTGIVYVRPGHIGPEFTIESLQGLFAAELDVTPPFIVVVRRAGRRVVVRLRRPR